MSVQNPCPQHQPNKRELYKNQKLQQLNQIYLCQCGKNYLTFSALYLHARNKHDIKLTTKRNDANSKLEKKEQKTFITYFINKKNISQGLQSVKLQEIQNQEIENLPFKQIIQLLYHYLEQPQCKVNIRNNSKKTIINHFITYFQQIPKEDAQTLPQQIESITLYYNDFILNFLPLALQDKTISNLDLSKAESELINLWRWLILHKYTQSKLLYRTAPKTSS